MNMLREIVTKAIVAKGKKRIKLNSLIQPENHVYSVLGCWIINHDFETIREEDTIIVNGSFEVNVWYSLQNNTKTEVTRKKITYEEKIVTKQIVNDYILDTEEVEARIVEAPSVVNASIKGEDISAEIEMEILAEIIGETKIQVTIFRPEEEAEDLDDFENQIDENFLKTNER